MIFLPLTGKKSKLELLSTIPAPEFSPALILWGRSERKSQAATGKFSHIFKKRRTTQAEASLETQIRIDCQH